MLKQNTSLINKLQENKRYHFLCFLAILTLLTLVMILACEPVTFYIGHDYFFHMRRLNALIDAFRDGTFPSYIDYTAALNYGYLSGVFYSDFTLIPFALVGLFTGAVFAYSFLLFSITILSGIFTYITVNKIYNNTFAAAVSGLLYTFCSYRMYDLYHRGALGESIALTFTPIVFLGLYHIIKGDYKKKWYILTIGFSLLVFTHAISTLLMFITTVLILLFYIKPLIKEPKRLAYLLLSGSVCLLILAYYFYPMLEQSAAIEFYFKGNPVNLPYYKKLSLKVIAWGFVSGVAYPKDGYFSGIGLLLTLAACLRLFVREKSAKIRSVDIGVVIGLFYILLSSRITPWESFPFTLIRSIQFPARFFGYTSFFFAVAGGYYLSILCKSNRQKLIAYICVTLASIVVISIHSDNYKYLTSRYFVDNRPQANTFFHLYGSEFMPVRIPSAKFLVERGELVKTKNADTQVSHLDRKRNITVFDINVTKPDSAELPLAYYLGYKVTLNGKEIPTSQSRYGLIEIPVNQSGRVEAYYAGTTVQKVSFYITMVSILALCMYIYISQRQKKR